MKWSNLKRKSRSIACLGAALAVILGLTAAMTPAYAVPIDFDAECSISITTAGTDTTDDLKMKDVVCDIYKIADAVSVEGYDTYAFDLKTPYDGLTISDEMTHEEQAELAQKAAKIALTDGGDVPYMTSIACGPDVTTNLDMGLFMIIARGADTSYENKDKYVKTIEDEEGVSRLVTTSETDYYEYLYAPVLISMPTKDADENGFSMTSSQSEWIYNMTGDNAVVLKPTQMNLFGSLRIVKQLDDQWVTNPDDPAADSATFVYQIDAYEDESMTGTPVWSDVCAVHFSAAGINEYYYDKQIPAGTYVKVTEVYTGSAYESVGDKVQTVKIEKTGYKDEAVVEVSFENKYDNKVKQGHGITNHFTYNSEEEHWNEPEQIRTSESVVFN